MSNPYFRFKQFFICQDQCAMKVTTDACLFGACLSSFVSNKNEIVNVLDIGTGTGLLALMYAQKNFKAEIDAIEIDKDAAGQAKENFARSPWHERISIIHADVKNFVSEKKYDLVISNPPFYEQEPETADDKKNTARHSKHLALEELLGIIGKNLSPQGRFALLLPFKRFEATRRWLNRHELHPADIVLVKQSPKHDYFRVMLYGALKNKCLTETRISEMMIWDERQQYTPEFCGLLKDYYLYL